MSSFSNDMMDFSEVVQAYFLKQTGKGLIFSSRDLDLLMRWEASGCSPATICQGIDAAIQRSNRPPRDLFSCKNYIEEGLPHPSQNSSPSLVKKLIVEPANSSDISEVFKRELESTPSSVFRPAYEAALSFLDRHPHADIFELEDHFFAKAFSSLSKDEQHEINEGIEVKLQSVLRTMSTQAREATLNAKRREIMEERDELSQLFK